MRSENYEEILDDPRRIFNFDEVAMYLHPTKTNVIARKGAKIIYCIGSGNEKECVTVLLGGNALGEAPPTLVTFKGERVPKHLLFNLPKVIVADKSKSGWMNGEIFFNYIRNVFFPWAKSHEIPFPLVVFIDGHASHLTLPLCEFCSKNDIILVALLPNATHIYQPMDIGVIFPLKQIWKRRRQAWEIENRAVSFSRNFFSALLSESLENCIQIKRCFRTHFVLVVSTYKRHYCFHIIHSFEFFFIYRFVSVQCGVCQLQ